MKIIYRIHAVQRMFQRFIDTKDVRFAIENGETIENYPEDTPYPSRLILGWSSQRPIHIVIAENLPDEELIVITVYEPDPDLWEADFRARRKS